MSVTRLYRKYIYCLEGEWERVPSRKTMRPALEFLEQLTKPSIEFVHRNCISRDSLRQYFSMLKEKTFCDYTIVYLAFHGKKNCIQVGNDLVSLDDLVELADGAFKNRIVYFGACNTLGITKADVKDFIIDSGAVAVCGYKTKVDFMKSSVLDLLFFEKCQHYKRISALDNNFRTEYSKQVDDLQFQLIHRKS